MAEPANLSAIQRMTRRAHATPAPDRGTRAKRAFQRAVRRAGAPFPGLSPEPQKEEVNWGLPLGDLLTELPDGGLLIGLDAPQNRRGLCLLQQPFIKDTSLAVVDIVNEAVGKLGENIRVKRFTRFSIGE